MQLLSRRVSWLVLVISGFALFGVGHQPAAAAGALEVTTTSLADATNGTAYTQTLAVTGGTTPYAWSISAGALPDGLTLNATSGAISGTPTKEGVLAFTAKVTDAANASATRDLSVTVKPAKAPPSKDELAARVKAVCDARGAEQPFKALCDVFFSVTMPPFAQNAVGHFILKLDSGNAAGHKKDEEPDDDRDDQHDTKPPKTGNHGQAKTGTKGVDHGQNGKSSHKDRHE